MKLRTCWKFNYNEQSLIVDKEKSIKKQRKIIFFIKLTIAVYAIKMKRHDEKRKQQNITAN